MSRKRGAVCERKEWNQRAWLKTRYVDSEVVSTDKNKRAVYQIETEGLSIKQKQKGCLHAETEGLSANEIRGNRRAVHR